MSENCAVLTWANDPKPGCVGRAATGVEIRIADDGEVLARGGNVCVGYLGKPEQTAETIDEDGWWHTGDIGVLDDDGYLKIVDRKKELIITAGGKNLSPSNLEAALKMIPLVGQAIAIGDARPFVSALVVLDPDVAPGWAASKGIEYGSLEELAENPEVVAEIEAALPGVMAGFNNAERVKKVKILGEEWLPDTELLTPTSKLKRRGIHAHYAEEIEALYA
jgi:long-chain acyl-CoA synthetase